MKFKTALFWKGKLILVLIFKMKSDLKLKLPFLKVNFIPKMNSWMKSGIFISDQEFAKITKVLFVCLVLTEGLIRFLNVGLTKLRERTQPSIDYINRRNFSCTCLWLLLDDHYFSRISRNRKIFILSQWEVKHCFTYLSLNVWSALS